MGNYRAAFMLAGTGFWAVVAWSFGFTPVQIIVSSVLALIALLAASVLLAPPSKDETAPVSNERR